MKLTKYTLLAVAFLSAATTGNISARSTSEKAWRFAKRTVYFAAPFFLRRWTYEYILNKNQIRSKLRFMQEELAKDLVLGAYAAYFWPKAVKA